MSAGGREWRVTTILSNGMEQEHIYYDERRALEMIEAREVLEVPHRVEVRTVGPWERFARRAAG